jgi:hypothetical protein
MTADLPTVGGYSFYLNIVVIKSGHREDSTHHSDESQAGTAGPVGQTTTKTKTESQKNQNRAVVPGKIVDGKSFVDSLAFRAMSFVADKKQSVIPPDPAKFIMDGQRLMNSIGHSISKSSSNITKRATAFVASKTAVSRAEKAVVECIPLVTEEIGVEISISKRFQHGPVFVLEVDMKGCDLLELLEKVLGKESAHHYRNIRQGLLCLGMLKSLAAFDQEILPKVRQNMMNKMSEIVPEKMKLKKSNADLEIQCVALEDNEEAKWLYNFLEFMDQMK